MASISGVVKESVDKSSILQEVLREGIVSFGALAEKLKPRIEAALGREVKHSAVVMALRRHAEELESHQASFPIPQASELVLKTNLVDIGVAKSPTLFKTLEHIYPAMGYEEGDTFNIIHGNREVSLVTNRKYLGKVLELFSREKVLTVEENLVSLSMVLGREFFYTPGIIFSVVRRLAWEDINIYEIVSTSSELAFILHKKDATRAYHVLQEMDEHQSAS